MLCVDCCVVCVDCWLLFGICYLIFVVCCLLFVACGVLCVVCCVLFVVQYGCSFAASRSVIFFDGVLHVVWCALFGVRRLLLELCADCHMRVVCHALRGIWWLLYGV